VLHGQLRGPINNLASCVGPGDNARSAFAADGFTHEGMAIKDWIQRGHRMPPMTYLSLAHQELIPNNALHFAIQECQIRQKQLINLNIPFCSYCQVSEVRHIFSLCVHVS
jgi:hypothetical protein